MDEQLTPGPVEPFEAELALPPAQPPEDDPDTTFEAQPEHAPDPGEREAPLAGQTAATRVLLDRVRELMLASEPAIAPELLAGETLEELEASFAAARETVRRVREAVQREGPAVPAGAPGRTPPAPLSAFEKIRAGLSRIGG